MKFSLCLLLSSLFCFAIFSCKNSQQKNEPSKKDTSIAVIEDWKLIPFTKVDSVNPVMKPGDATFNCPVRKHRVAWEMKDVFNPAVAVKQDTLFLLYRAQDKIGKPG